MQLPENEVEFEQESIALILEKKLLDLQEKLKDTKHKYQETISIVDDLESKLRREQQQQRANARKLTEINKKLNILEKECNERYVQIMQTRQLCRVEKDIQDLVKEDQSEVTSIELPSVSRMLEEHIMEEALHQEEANDSTSSELALIPHEANVYSQDGEHIFDDPTPLHAAAVTGRKSAVFALLKASADVNARAYTSATPLICAAKGGNVEISQLLIKFGANVNFHDSKNMTALHYACSRGSRSLTRLLIKSGANLAARADNKTPADTAESNGHKRLAKYIRSKMK